MAKKSKIPPSAEKCGPPPPKIYLAILGTGGDVLRGDLITESDAVQARLAGRDVVVCGEILADNKALAQRIETAAHGGCVLCPPHVHQGPGALYHFHPDPREKAGGHCFYETTTRKSKKPKPPRKKSSKKAKP